MYKIYKTITSKVFVTALFIVKIENNLRFFLIDNLIVKCRNTKTDYLLIKILYIYIYFLSGSDSKESAWNAGDQGSVPGSGKSPGEGNSNPF